MDLIQHEGKFFTAYMTMTGNNLSWHDNTITYLF